MAPTMFIITQDGIQSKFKAGLALLFPSTKEDVEAAMEEAKNNGSSLPVTELVDKHYGEVQELGGNRWDTSSLIKRFRKENR